MGLLMMTHRALAALPALLLAALATTSTARADGVANPAASPSPAPAPQNADWKDVSHINGQLVKVGESNDYHYTFKKTIVSTNPIGWIYGAYGVSVSHALNNHVAVRGDVNYLSGFLDEETSGMEVGVGAPIYFRRTYQGVFLEPGFISRRLTHTCQGCSGAGGDVMDSETTFGPQMLMGWHWTWDSGLNVAVAAGVGRNWSSADDEWDSEKIFANGYLRFGYAF